MPTSPCFSGDELHAYSLGLLDDERSGHVAAHLNGCLQCEETISRFDDTADSLLGGVRRALVEKSNRAATAAAVDGQDASPSDRILHDIPNPWVSSSPVDSNPHESADAPSAREWIRDYELLESLGSGGMGTVYKAVHRKLDRVVAIKVLPSRRLTSADAINRFRREMKAIGRLDHPAIVRATDAGEADGTHFIAMDFVDGLDVSRLARVTGPMDIATAAEIVRQAALGLQYAHEQGLVHRDVKPGNLMVELPTARVKILDLGLALFGAASEAVDDLTTVGQLMGTLDYMAPEQADNSHAVDVRADIYSLGATLFKLLTGSAPYESDDRKSPLKKMKALATIDAPPIRSVRPEVPEDIATIVDQMLRRDPNERFQSAADVAHALLPFTTGQRLADVTGHAIAARIKVNHREGEAPAEPLLVAPGNGSAVPARREPSRIAPSEISPSRIAPSPTYAQPPRRTWLRSALLPAAFAAVLIAGVVLRIQTDTGTLVIECAAGNVPIEIRQAGESVKQLTLSAGKNTVTLRSGRYEVVLPAEHDRLTVEAGTVELTRGTEWVAKITETLDAVAESTNASLPPSTSGTGESGLSATPSLPASSIASMPLPRFTDPLTAIEFAHLRDRYAELLRSRDKLEASLETASQSLGGDHPRIKTLTMQLALGVSELDETRRKLEMVLAEEHAREAEQQSTSNDTVIAFDDARISDTTNATTTGQRVYNGKSITQWLELLETEVSPEELIPATDALWRLAASATVDVQERVGIMAAGLYLRHAQEPRTIRTNNENTVSPAGRITANCQKALEQLSLETRSRVVAVVLREAPDHQLLKVFGSPLFEDWSVFRESSPTELVNQMLADQSATSILLHHWPTATAQSKSALYMIADAIAARPPVDEQVISLLTQIASDREVVQVHPDYWHRWGRSVREMACTRLVDLQPDTPNLAESLWEELTERDNRNWSVSIDVGWLALHRLGPRASVLQEKVLRRVSESLVRSSSATTYSGRSGDERPFGPLTYIDESTLMLELLRQLHKTGHFDPRNNATLETLANESLTDIATRYGHTPMPIEPEELEGAVKLARAAWKQYVANLKPGPSVFESIDAIARESRGFRILTNDLHFARSEEFWLIRAHERYLALQLLGREPEAEWPLELPASLTVNDSEAEAVITVPMDAATANPSSIIEPVYEGKTLNQWLLTVQTERSLTELTKAVDAIAILGREGRDKDAAEAILQMMGQHRFEGTTRSDQEELFLTIAMTRALRSLAPDITASAIATGFRNRPPLVHEHIILGVLDDRFQIRGVYAGLPAANTGDGELLWEAVRASETFATELLTLVTGFDGMYWPEPAYPVLRSSAERSGDPALEYFWNHSRKVVPDQQTLHWLRNIVELRADGTSVIRNKKDIVFATLLLSQFDPKPEYALTLLEQIETETPFPVPAGGMGGPTGRAVRLERHLPLWQSLAIIGPASSALCEEKLVSRLDRYNSHGLQTPATIQTTARADAVYHYIEYATPWAIRWTTKPGDPKTLDQRTIVDARLMSIEVLAATQASTEPTLIEISSLIRRLAGQPPVEGPHQFKVHRGLLPLTHPAQMQAEGVVAVLSGNPNGRTPDSFALEVRVETLNSALLAWEKLTGKPAMFASPDLGELGKLAEADAEVAKLLPKLVTVEQPGQSVEQK